MTTRTFQQLLDALLGLGFTTERLCKAQRVHEDAQGQLHTPECSDGGNTTPHIYGFDRIMKHAHVCILRDLVALGGDWSHEVALLDSFDAINEGASIDLHNEVKRYTRIQNGAETARNMRRWASKHDTSYSAFETCYTKLDEAAQNLLEVLKGKREEAAAAFQLDTWGILYTESNQWTNMTPAGYTEELTAIITGAVATDEIFASYVPLEVAQLILPQNAMNRPYFEFLPLDEKISYQQAAEKVSTLVENLEPGEDPGHYFQQAFAA